MANKNKEVTVYIDMDGVIADFDKAMKERGLTGNDLKMLRGTYRELEVADGAREGITALIDMGFDLHIATKIPDNNPYAATEKLLWLREHFPELAVNVTITPNKGQLGTVDDYLIDDRPHKANIVNFQGTCLHFGPEGKYQNWKTVIEYFNHLSYLT